MRCWKYSTAIILFILFALFNIQVNEASANDPVNPYWNTDESLGQPVFSLQAYRRLTDDPSLIRLDIAVEIMNDVLLFVREDTIFTASVEVNLSIINDKDQQIFRQVKYLTKSIQSFDRSNSRSEFLVGTFSTTLPSGVYGVIAVVADRESRRREKVRQNVILQKRDAIDMGLSDIMLSWSSELEPEGSTPRHLTVTGNVPDQSLNLFVYYDIVRPDPMTICHMSLSVTDWKDRETYHDSLSIVGGDNLAAYFMSVPCQELNYGKYKVRVVANYKGKSIERQAGFKINFFDLPGTIRDIDHAIKQLGLIATKKEIDAILSADDSEKERLFIKFWNEHFTTPGESVNGKMVEYYNRITYANQHFGSSSTEMGGWKSDRGRIYAIYGKPSEVERYNLDEYGTPYEVWFYNHLGKRFVFRDEFGFGEYKLVNSAW